MGAADVTRQILMQCISQLVALRELVMQAKRTQRVCRPQIQARELGKQPITYRVSGELLLACSFLTGAGCTRFPKRTRILAGQETSKNSAKW